MANHLISLRIAPAQLAALDYLAARSGMERADFVRAAVARAVGAEFARLSKEAGVLIPGVLVSDAAGGSTLENEAD